MERIERYVPIKVAVVDNQIIPFWELTAAKEDCYGTDLWVQRFNGKEIQLQDYAWDLKKQKLAETVVVELKKSSPDIEIGEMLYFESKYNHDGPKLIEQVTVLDIVFEKYDSLFKKGGYFKEYYRDMDYEFDSNVLYELRTWTPVYVLSNGQRTSHPSLHLYKIKS